MRYRLEVFWSCDEREFKNVSRETFLKMNGL